MAPHTPRGVALALFAALLVPVALLVPPGVDAQEAPAPSPASLAGRSLVLPGWGQWAQGQRRAVLYAAAEVALWAFWGHRRHQAADLRDGYRRLAWETARQRRGAYTDGPWSYYEDLSRWQRSGAFDGDGASPGIQPEEDPATFNGSVWRLARDLHFRGGAPGPGDPAYQAAVAWYQGRAYGDAYLWDWTGQEGAQAEFRDLIHRSDERFRQATTALGAVLANHVLSGADAFLSARVPGALEMRVRPPSSAPWAPLTLTLSWRPPS